MPSRRTPPLRPRPSSALPLRSAASAPSSGGPAGGIWTSTTRPAADAHPSPAAASTPALLAAGDVAAMVRERDPADGDLLLVFGDDDRQPLFTVDLDEGTRHVDELFVRHVVAVVCELRLPVVVAVSCRADGRPRRNDRLLWRELSARLAGACTTLLDLLVVAEAGARAGATSPAPWSANRSARPAGRTRPAPSHPRRVA